MLLAGLVAAGWVAPRLDDEGYLIRGGELILLALTRLALQGEFRSFFRGMVLTGVGLPLVGVGLTPIYYSGGYRLSAVMETGGLGAVLGAAFLVMGFVGLRRLARRDQEAPPDPPEAPGWVAWVETLCEGALWLVVVTLGAGTWSDVAVLAVGGGALALVAGLTVAFLYRSPFTRGEVGAGLTFVGAATVVVSILIVTFSNGRATEAVIGVPPGLVVGFVGLGMLGQR
jgi:hypothetical protein